MLSSNNADAGGKVIKPCKPGTEGYEGARKELATVDQAIEALAPAADPGPLGRRLTQLLEGECFQILDDEVPEHAKTGLALQDWWERGGRSYFGMALTLYESSPVIWVSPTLRPALTLETAPNHRLSTLLCADKNETCGRETAGWRLRAESAFRDKAAARSPKSGRSCRGAFRGRADQSCKDIALSTPQQRRFDAFRDCLDADAQPVPALPRGRFRAPHRGWLVVSGRRGHYHFCDELRVYDLATGALFRAASCSGLALKAGGEVDFRDTDRARRLVTERGTVALERLREAAWMLLLADEVTGVRESHGVRLPDGIPVVSTGNRSGGSCSTSTSSTNQTRLHWVVSTGRSDLGAGVLTWPRDLNQPQWAHAAELLEIAELSFERGCPPITPPAAAALELEGLSAHHLDADAPSLDQATAEVRAAYERLRTEPCKR